MTRFLGALCMFVAFALVGWVALEAGPIDGRHVLALVAFAAGFGLIMSGADELEERDW